MARFDVYRLPGAKPRYVVDIQTEFLSHLATRAILPLIPVGEIPGAVADLNPVVELVAGSFVVFTQLMAAVPKSDLKQVVASLISYRDEITRAIDLLLTGF